MKFFLLFIVSLCLALAAQAGSAPAGWPAWGGDLGGTRFSPLKQITAANVDALQVAWEYHTGDSSELKPGMPESSFLATPVLLDNTLYF